MRERALILTGVSEYTTYLYALGEGDSTKITGELKGVEKNLDRYDE